MLWASPVSFLVGRWRYLSLIHIFVGHPGNERSGRKSVDVSEGKLLYLVEQTLAQVSAKALAGEGGVFCRAHAAGHGEEGQQEHQTAHQKDVAHISGRDGHIHDLRHDQREDQLADDLQGNQDGGLDRVLLVPCLLYTSRCV